MDRANHYESAVAAYLRERHWCFIAVDESRRSAVGDYLVKSPDFLVYGVEGVRLLVDVKGRRFPGGTPAKPRRVWENWATRADVEGLDRWARRCGPGYVGMLLFAYCLADYVHLPEETPDLVEHDGRRYLLRAVTTADYRRLMRVRSPKWDTVCLPGPAFRTLVRPLATFLQSRVPATA